MTISLLSELGRELLPTEADENIRDLAERTQAWWKDLTSHLTIEWIPELDHPTYEAFAPSWLRNQLSFGIWDYANCSIFHLNHDVKVWGKAYVHIHWSTDWIDENTVKWEFQISYALGHDQDFFPATTSVFVEQAPNQVAPWAWRHYIAEIGDDYAMTLTEPDAIAMVTVRRVTNWAVDNTDKVFWLTVDFHYESDRDSTPNKSPDFYT